MLEKSIFSPENVIGCVVIDVMVVLRMKNLLL